MCNCRRAENFYMKKKKTEQIIKSQMKTFFLLFFFFFNFFFFFFLAQGKAGYESFWLCSGFPNGTIGNFTNSFYRY